MVSSCTAPSQQVVNRGLDDRSIKLGCVQPGAEKPAVYSDALRRLSDQAMYLYRDGTRYWYALQPTVNRIARDRAENHFSDDDADEVIRRLVDDALRQDGGHFTGVHACPRGPADVPDEDETRLVALDPTSAIEIEATTEDGFDEAIQSDIAENSVTLRFDTSDFES